jgi:hypothetical protein
MIVDISKNLLHSIPRKLYNIVLASHLACDTPEDEDPPETEELNQVLSSGETENGSWHLELDSGWIAFEVSAPPYGEGEPISVTLEWDGELVVKGDTNTLEFAVHYITSSSPLLLDAVNNLQFFTDCEASIYSMFK